MTVPAAQSKFNALTLRILSALVMIPAGLFVVFAGGRVLFIAGILCAAAMWYEYRQVTIGQVQKHPSLIAGGLLVLAILLAFEFSVPTALVLPGLMVCVYSLLIVLRVPNPLWLTVGNTLIGLAVISLLELRGNDQAGLVLILIVMISVWITDIAAYFAGRGFGGPQLSPRGSPNKTWSGAAGAMICTALVGAFTAGLVSGPILNWVIFTALVSVIGQLGDLTESLWKRQFKVKDSGNLIPGHGGILDRLDSFSAVLIVLGLVQMIYPDYSEHFLGLRSA